MKNRKIASLAILATVSLTLGFSTIASANGNQEDRPWQFRTPDQRAVALGTENFRLMENGGFFDQWNVDQDFNCEAGATCTQVGAGGVGSNSSTIGNYSDIDTTISTDNSVSVGDILNGDGSTFGFSSDGNAGASGNTANTDTTIDQTNSDSDLDSTVVTATSVDLGQGE